MDYIFVKDLEVECNIGADPGERDFPQLLRFSFEIPVSTSSVSANDDLADTVNYWEVSCRLKEIVAETSCRLIETLADKVATELLQEFELQQIKLTVEKPGAFEGPALSGVTVLREG